MVFDYVATVTDATSPAPFDATRAALLDAATSVLISQGAAALTVRRIATEAGMSTMNVYSRFGGKDGVIDELVADGFAKLAEAMRATPLSGNPVADLWECGKAYRAFALEHRAYYTVMFQNAVPDFHPSQDARAAATAALEVLAERLQSAMDAGVLQRADPFVTAACVWSTCHGVMSLELADHAPDLFDWNAIYEHTLTLLTAGMAPADGDARSAGATPGG